VRRCGGRLREQKEDLIMARLRIDGYDDQTHPRKPWHFREVKKWAGRYGWGPASGAWGGGPTVEKALVNLRATCMKYRDFYNECLVAVDQELTELLKEQAGKEG